MLSRTTSILIVVVILSISGFIIFSSSYPTISELLLLVFLVSFIWLLIRLASYITKRNQKVATKEVKKVKPSSSFLGVSSNLPTEYKALAIVLAFANLFLIIYEDVNVFGTQASTPAAFVFIFSLAIFYGIYTSLFEEYKRKKISSMGILGNTLLCFIASWPALLLYRGFLYLVSRYDKPHAKLTVVRICLGIIALAVVTIIMGYLIPLL